MKKNFEEKKISEPNKLQTALVIIIVVVASPANQVYS